MDALPSRRVVSFDTDDVDEFNQRPGGWSVQYHVLDAAAFRSAVWLMMTPSVQVAYVQHAMGYSSQGDNPAGMLSIGARLDEARPMVYRERAVGPLEMTVARSGEGYENVCPSGARFAVVSLPQEKVVGCAAARDVPSVRELCAVTGASYATLERGFRETYGMTPKAMMTATRLSGARRALLHPDATTTVTAVALRWGFVDLGRFAVQYRQRFGERPSETLCRVRGLPPGSAKSDRDEALVWTSPPSVETS